MHQMQQTPDIRLRHERVVGEFGLREKVRVNTEVDAQIVLESGLKLGPKCGQGDASGCKLPVLVFGELPEIPPALEEVADICRRKLTKSREYRLDIERS